MGNLEKEKYYVNYHWKIICVLSIIMWNLDLLLRIIPGGNASILSSEGGYYLMVCFALMFFFFICAPAYIYIHTFKAIYEEVHYKAINPYKIQMTTILLSTSVFIPLLIAYINGIMPFPGIYSLLKWKLYLF